jgi:two-component system chemotaxis response regulator CheY
MKFLVIDDSKTQRKLMVKALELMGIKEIIEAENGLEGYKLIKESKIDFVLLDCDMPVLNGLEFLKLVRANESIKNTPIIMVSSKGSPDDVIKAIRSKANNYIVKPFTPKILEQKIKEVLKLNSGESIINKSTPK